MDMKKKLQETYMPDKEGRKKRVIVALSGGLNSFVTAYLLKIQKYELIGVTVSINWDEFDKDPSSVLSCYLNQPKLESIKEFCHQLGIPHFLVKASDEFKDEVVDSWVGSKVSGVKPNPCWNCHDLRMRLLYRKMVELDGHGLATGHLAKIFHQEAHESVYVHTSNDEVYDQSVYLSRLPHEVLKKLMLPLSDLTQKEINKLGENFGLNEMEKTIKMHECFENHTQEYLVSHVPNKYQQGGELVDTDKVNIGNHEGILNYEAGKIYPMPNQRKDDFYITSKFSMMEKKLEVAKKDHFKRKKIFLNQCRISEETPWVEPLKGVLKLNENDFIDCWIYPKNVSSAVIEMEEAHEIYEGQIVTILKKKGRNSKVYLTGKVRFVNEEPVRQEEGKDSVKVDYSRDF